MMKYVVETRNLRVVRGGAPVLDGIDLAVSEGAITGLLGPSGCGKTTLLRVIVGTQRITEGEVTVLGRRAGAAALRHEVGYGSQQAAIYADLTVEQNLAYFASAVGAPPGDVRRVMEAVDLGRVAGRVAGRLSGGQRSRVSLAVALLGSPKLILLDEPTVGLDPVLRNGLWGLFRDLTRDGMSMIVSSHVMDEAERCDDLLVMREGKMLAADTPARLTERTGTSSVEEAFLHLVADGDAEAA